MKPPRLAELQRQRELVREHLAWLDREIAAASGNSPAEPASSTPARGGSDISFPTPQAALSAPPDPVRAAASARRGCFVFAALAALLFAGVLAGIYFAKYRDRPLLFAEEGRDAPALPER